MLRRNYIDSPGLLLRVVYSAGWLLDLLYSKHRLDKLVADIKVMSSAISHELRSPLAKLRFGLDALAEEDNPEKRIVYEARLSNEVDKMTSLIAEQPVIQRNKVRWWKDQPENISGYPGYMGFY